jgi:hypothetical protein
VLKLINLNQWVWLYHLRYNGEKLTHHITNQHTAIKTEGPFDKSRNSVGRVIE